LRERARTSDLPHDNAPVFLRQAGYIDASSIRNIRCEERPPHPNDDVLASGTATDRSRYPIVPPESLTIRRGSEGRLLRPLAIPAQPAPTPWVLTGLALMGVFSNRAQRTGRSRRSRLGMTGHCSAVPFIRHTPSSSQFAGSPCPSANMHRALPDCRPHAAGPAPRAAKRQQGRKA